MPVATPSAYEELRHRVDKLVCVIPPQPFDSVGVWYEDASRTTILDVCDLLTGAAFEQTADAPIVPLYEIGW